MKSSDLGLMATRRNFFRNCAGGLGAIAAAHLLEREGRAAASESSSPLAPKKSHFPGTAKNVIFLFMPGGPSQLDLFDPKPELRRWHGKPLPPSLTKDLKLAFVKPNASVLASPREFKRHGRSGTEISDFLPHVGVAGG